MKGIEFNSIEMKNLMKETLGMIFSLHKEAEDKKDKIIYPPKTEQKLKVDKIDVVEEV